MLLEVDLDPVCTPQGIALVMLLTNHTKAGNTHLQHKSTKITSLRHRVDCLLQNRERVCVWSKASPFRPKEKEQCTVYTVGETD